MAGLLGDVLPYIYQRANALKRGLGDFVSDPVGSITQGVNYANDRAGGLLEATRAASEESAAGGGLMYGPANKKLAGILANAYNPMGITVYHGSPHKFAKFDSSKIGTGEGAQAYGHGLYMAESPDVATRYRDTLTNFRPDHIEAKLVEAGISPEFANTYSQFAAQTNGGARSLDDFAELMAKPGPSPYIEQFRQRIRAELPAARKASDAITGSLYKVDLPDSAVARMLDWDKPLSQQAPEVLAALEKSDARYGPINNRARIADVSVNGPISGGSVYNDIARALVPDGQRDIWRGATPISGQGARAAEHMRSIGIPGIRYLDGGSRGAGAGTSNFVVFDDSLLTILERNGLPLPK